MYSTVESVSQTTSETSLSLVRGRMFPDLMSSKLHEELVSCESNEYCELEKTATVYIVRSYYKMGCCAYSGGIGDGLRSAGSTDQLPTRC